MLEIEGGSTGSYLVEKSLWKRLWTNRQIGYVVKTMMVTVVMVVMRMTTVMRSQVRGNQRSLCRNLFPPLLHKYYSLPADSSGKLCVCVCVSAFAWIEKNVKCDTHRRYSVSIEACEKSHCDAKSSALNIKTTETRKLTSESETNSGTA